MPPYEAIKRFRHKRGRCGHRSSCGGRKSGADIDRGLGCTETCADIASEVKSQSPKTVAEVETELGLGVKPCPRQELDAIQVEVSALTLASGGACTVQRVADPLLGARINAELLRDPLRVPFEAL